VHAWKVVSLGDPQPDTGHIPPPARQGGGCGGHMLPVVPDTVPQLVVRHAVPGLVPGRADLGGRRTAEGVPWGYPPLARIVPY
jgi:hypothetical protein